MKKTTFIIISVLYLTSLALVDSLFNRLVFRQERTLPYLSQQKEIIYKYWEWKAIGVIFLFFLAIILPSVISYVIGRLSPPENNQQPPKSTTNRGISFVTLYWIILLLVPWDLIFGALVFDNIFGDTPSIALPFYRWIHLSLALSLIIRIILATIITILKIRLGI